MGSISEAPSTPSPIPIIDFSPFLTSPDPQTRLRVAHDLISAFQRVGFVYLANHGLPQYLLDQAFSVSQHLFNLPLEQKQLAPHPPGPEVHRGYSYPGLEKVSQYSGGDVAKGEELREVVDCKESYEIGSEANASQPNIWLPEDVLPGFRSFTTQFYWSCNEVAQSILRCISLGLGLQDPGL